MVYHNSGGGCRRGGHGGGRRDGWKDFKTKKKSGFPDTRKKTGEKSSPRK